MKNTDTVVYTDGKIKAITKTAIMAALVFLATYIFKIPTPNGYMHLGDCFVFVAVMILGTKKGAVAGGMGEAMADLIGGYTHWVLPTFIIKAIMAGAVGLAAYKLFPRLKYGWLIGAAVGGVLQLVLYALVKIPMYGMPYVITTFASDSVQTIFGIVAAAVIISALNGSHITEKLRNM